MILPPLADTHVHLLAGLDDGPMTLDVALAMCRMLTAEGARHATALCHQNGTYPDNTPNRLRSSATALAEALAERNIPLSVYSTGEVMLTPDLVADWSAGRFESIGGHRRWLLIEMPHGAFIDFLPVAAGLRPLGLRPVVAHAERYPELLHDPALAERWISAGCLIQVTAQALADPWSTADERALRLWASAGFIHLLGSDGHGIDRRPPRLAAGFRQLARWAGRPTAERIGSHWGIAILQGLPINVPLPARPKRRWFSRLFGG